MQFQTTQLPVRANYIAPDGSEIRLLPDVKGGGLSHCTLYPSHTSAAVKHHSIEEIWYFIQGEGEVWRRSESLEAIEFVRPGVCITIPAQTHFQFRNTGTVPLTFIIATMPPSPGPNEAERVRDHWTTSVGS